MKKGNVGPRLKGIKRNRKGVDRPSRGKRKKKLREPCVAGIRSEGTRGGEKNKITTRKKEGGKKRVGDRNQNKI